jgi:predicted RNA-binding protein
MAISKTQKLKQLRTKLNELEEVKLKQALTKYGEAYQESGAAWQEDAAWELADEEVSVLRAMVAEVKIEIRNLEHTSQPLQKIK